MIPQSARCRSILVPLDGSKLAEQAIPVAQAIAQRAGCQLKLVLVHQLPVGTKPGPDCIKLELAMLKADRGYLKSVTAAVRERLGRQVSSAVLRGHPVAQRWRSMGRRRRKPRSGLRWKPQGFGMRSFRWSRSSVPFSRPARSSTCPRAIGVRPMPCAGDRPRDYIRDVAERVRESGIRASGVAVIGDNVPETLIDLAEPKRVSLMVVATHGLGGAGRLVLGSVADEVVRGANVPVLVVRPTGRPAGPGQVESMLRPGTSGSISVPGHQGPSTLIS